MTAGQVVRAVLTGLLLVIMCLSALAGIAAAVWSSMGAGSGSGGSGTTVAVTLSPGTPSNVLYPGGKASVVLGITSSNSAPVRIGSLALDAGRGTGGFAVDGGHAGCSVSALSFTTQTNGTTGWTVPAKSGAVNGSLAVTLVDALSMSTAAANACQAATFTVYLAAAP
jgi:hypothetical protein